MSIQFSSLIINQILLRRFDMPAFGIELGGTAILFRAKYEIGRESEVYLSALKKSQKSPPPDLI